jgi:hypothetical protein
MEISQVPEGTSAWSRDPAAMLLSESLKDESARTKLPCLLAPHSTAVIFREEPDSCQAAIDETICTSEKVSAN